MSTPVLSIGNFALEGRWVPGTMDRVYLNRADEEKLEIGIILLGQMFGQEAINTLYLQGKTKLSCDPQRWGLLAAGSVQPLSVS